MKKCDYCAKEISYHQMYCDDVCEENAQKFYAMRESVEKTMGIINGICVLSMGLGFFLFAFSSMVGAYMVSIPMLILGALFVLFPIPAEVMINKNKIEKAVKTTRIIGFIVLALGVIATVLSIILI